MTISSSLTSCCNNLNITRSSLLFLETDFYIFLLFDIFNSCSLAFSSTFLFLCSIFFCFSSAFFLFSTSLNFRFSSRSLFLLSFASSSFYFFSVSINSSKDCSLVSTRAGAGLLPPLDLYGVILEEIKIQI